MKKADFFIIDELMVFKQDLLIGKYVLTLKTKKINWCKAFPFFIFIGTILGIFTGFLEKVFHIPTESLFSSFFGGFVVGGGLCIAIILFNIFIEQGKLSWFVKKQ